MPTWEEDAAKAFLAAVDEPTAPPSPFTEIDAQRFAAFLATNHPHHLRSWIDAQLARLAARGGCGATVDRGLDLGPGALLAAWTEGRGAGVPGEPDLIRVLGAFFTAYRPALFAVGDFLERGERAKRRSTRAAARNPRS
jgi:hypothetical protein